MTEGLLPSTRFRIAALGPGCWMVTVLDPPIEKSFQLTMARWLLWLMVSEPLLGAPIVAAPLTTAPPLGNPPFAPCASAIGKPTQTSGASRAANGSVPLPRRWRLH